jgi:serine protease Do
LGHVLTKASELDGPVRCKGAGGDTFKAEIVGIDRALDMALLRTSRTDLPPVTFANALPPLGSWLAVTNHHGEDPLLVGVISSIAREIPQDRGFLGVLLGETSQGSRVDHVLQESSAEKFGLITGDIIYAIDGRRIRDRRKLIRTVQQFQPGAHVEFEILRDGKRITRQITLTRENEVAAAEDGSRQHEGGPLSNRRSGFAEVLQHDCPLRPNQCGGPLVDLDGRVVGLNIARAGRVESYAIPSHLVQASLARLKASSN